MRRYVYLLLLVVLAACNLETARVVTPEPSATPYIPPTPYIAPTLGAQGVVVTPAGSNLLTPVPAQSLIEQPAPPQTTQNAIEAFVNNHIIPAWNFL